MSQAVPAQNLPFTIVSLQDVQTHLRMPPGDTSDDASLQGFINAATDVIQHECGQVVPQQFDELLTTAATLPSPSDTSPSSPFLMLKRVGAGQTYELTYVQVNAINATNIFAYSIDDESVGLITRRTGGNVNIPFMRGTSNIRITYVAGQATVPGAIRLACLELIAHWWQGSQMRAGQYQSTGYDTMNVDFSRTLGGTEFNAGIPYRVIELLRPFRHIPFIG